MNERAPVGPATSDKKARGGGWMRFVPPQPRAKSLRDAERLLRRAAGECGAWAVVLVVAVALLAPVLVFAVAGGWAIFTYASMLITLWRNVKTYQLSDLTPLLHALDTAARVALASAGYFALLAALIVLMAGLLGKRWRRLFLFPGITFTLPSALAFFLGVRLSLDVLAAPLRVSGLAQTALLTYLLLDTVLLAAALVDVSPRRRHVRRTRWPRWMVWRRTPPAALAPIHFGPSGPLAAHRTTMVEAAGAASDDTMASEEPATEASTSGARLRDSASVDAMTTCQDDMPETGVDASPGASTAYAACVWDAMGESPATPAPV